MLVRVMPNDTRRQSYLYTIVGVGERGGVECVAGGTVRGLSWVCVVARACVLSWVEILKAMANWP